MLFRKNFRLLHTMATFKYTGEVPKISLNETESQIIEILNKYTNSRNDNIILRITGGWVRDKLLNKPSHDIDIGIEGCSGESFVMGLQEWLDGNDATKIHKIKKNPEKSKHLETCTTKICGLDIDFVNLRSESYTKDSRIPNITEGTPIEDAFRRDATLNALFFNLKKMEIEDLTGSGLKDLSDKILRTPLDSKTTFLDDPLRCLRLIRFASNYGFKLDSKAIESMKLNEIKDALKTKISRERIGVEFKKMIENKRGIEGIIEALKLIKEVEFTCIFDLGDTIPIPENWENEFNHKYLLNEGILDSIDNIINYEKREDLIIDDINDSIIFYCSLILNKWGNEKIKIGKKINYVSYYCILNGIKMPLKIAEYVSLIISKIPKNEEFFKIEELNRFEIAEKFILPFKDKWLLNLKINKCLGTKKTDEILNKINELELQNIYKENLLINGKEVMTIVNKKAGPWLKNINEELFKWQINNPNKDKEEMVKYLKSII